MSRRPGGTAPGRGASTPASEESAPRRKEFSPGLAESAPAQKESPPGPAAPPKGPVGCPIRTMGDDKWPKQTFFDKFGLPTASQLPFSQFRPKATPRTRRLTRRVGRLDQSGGPALVGNLDESAGGVSLFDHYPRPVAAFRVSAGRLAPVFPFCPASRRGCRILAGG